MFLGLKARIEVHDTKELRQGVALGFRPVRLRNVAQPTRRVAVATNPDPIETS